MRFNLKDFITKKIYTLSNYKRIITIILLLILFDVFLIKSPLVFVKDIIALRFFANYFISTAALVFFVLLLDLLFKKRLVFKIIASFLLIVPLGIQCAHYAFYKMPITTYAARFFLREPLLTMRLGMQNIHSIKIICFLIFCTILIILFKPVTKPVKYKTIKFIIYLCFYVPLVVLCGVNWYLILDFQNPIISVYAVIPETCRATYFKKLSAQKPLIHLNPTNKKLPNILWIIGESVSKYHMGIYGYLRNTTPHLNELKSNGDLIPFQNVVSIGPHTIISVPYMLVGLQNIDPSGLIFSTPNIFDYAKARNYDTALISSQDLRWRNFDQLVGGPQIVDFFKSGPDFNPSVNVEKGANDMDVLDASILPHLKSMRGPFLLVAHMDGSHYPYNIHSESKYKKFFPENSPNGINAYDNTIVYSDIYLSRLIEAARKKDPNIWIFYTTDHGQPVPLAIDNPIAKKIISTKDIHFLANIKTDLKTIKETNTHDDSDKDKQALDAKGSVFSAWRDKIASIFNKKDGNDDESKIIFNQGYEQDIIHNAFFIVPPDSMRTLISKNINAPVAQSDIFATILDLMDIKAATPIDALSLLKPISKNRLRVSTGFVTTNDNVPEAEITLPDQSSYFIDFSRRSISLPDGKTVLPLEDAPEKIKNLFKGKINPKMLN